MSTEKMLNENWNETKAALLDGVSSRKSALTEAVLENQRQYLLKENAVPGNISAGDIANFRKNLLPVIRRVIPGTIATEIVGVQPMSGPVDQVFTVRWTYEEGATDTSSNPFGTGTVASGDEAFGNNPVIRGIYTGQAGASGGQPAGASGFGQSDIASASATGKGWNSDPSVEDVTAYSGRTQLNGEPVGGPLYGGGGGYLEASGGRKMGLNLVSQAVQSKSRKVQAGWTLEAMQDAERQHNLNLETEMTRVMSAQLVQDIDAEVISDLLLLAGTSQTFDMNQTGGTTYAPAFVGDRLANLGPRINAVANEIGRKTRKGAGNFVVVSPMIASALQSATKAVFSPAVQGSFKSPSNTELLGVMNGSVKVYSYIWNQAQPYVSSTVGGSDQILVGYKGGNGETDAGYFYCPYIPVMSTGVIMNPITTTPIISLMTRYGKAAFTDTHTSLGNSADYYGKINVVDLDFV